MILRSFEIMKNSFPVIILSLCLLLACSNEELTTDPTPPDEPVDMPTEPIDHTTDDIYGDIRNISSIYYVAEMGIGWNLGNSFDVRSANKTAWGNPLPTTANIKAVRDFGFETLRIPVTWNYNMQATAPYTIDPNYLNRVQEIVEAGLRQSMHVIINTHHDDWIRPTDADLVEVSARLSSLWTQVATHFADYGDKLIFEVMNEPRLIDSPQEWLGGTTEGRSVVNQFIQVSLDAIRTTGGKNENRQVMVSTYAASTVPAAFDDMIIPDDPNLIISIHSYFPWSFTGNDNGPNIWGTDSEKSQLDSELDRIRQKWVVEQNRPVILGEWGAKNKNNISDRVTYADYYAKAAIERDMVPIVWDDGGDFGLFNRNSNIWNFRQIAQVIVNAGQ